MNQFVAGSGHKLSEPTRSAITNEAKRALRDALGAFPTGVTVITTRQQDGTPRGFTANSFTSVSLDPPLLLVCLAKTAHSCQVFAEAPQFGVSILSDSQKEVANLFASRRPDKFDEAAWHPGVSGVPLLDGAVAIFECQRDSLVDAGDHVILIGQITDFDSRGGNPLGYHRGAFFTLGTEDSLVAAAARGAPLHFGAILRFRDSILFKTEADGSLSVPSAPPGSRSHAAMIKHFTSLGIEPQAQALYAVYDDTQAGYLSIFYHGTATGGTTPDHLLIPIQGIPFDRIGNVAERSMLERYAAEARHGGFGIYQGTETAGTVHQIAKNQ
ncbi:flavin reductase family protein (plasmid) [Aminobacter sp. SR38]|jgi:flavin reductase (DIM6/NTAB) family NADH-FMN oxidoreductase RutF|uniref:flavin reductase family protein n=1 Tax=Aminobacter sp. SR38 TaxID=2774562 RepID=UPI00177E7F88|nr:flavin reductase family protein [Aminobacter sp. SR38]QOF75064.1 flavin reductase family protein [Aminobacter sp. SR38]